jgi:hypothetical protein
MRLLQEFCRNLKRRLLLGLPLYRRHLRHPPLLRLPRKVVAEEAFCRLSPLPPSDLL